MATYTTTLAASKPAPATSLVVELQNMRDSLNELVSRMRAAMAAIAEVNGVEPCEYCGEYTEETIEVGGYSDEIGYESMTYCPACVPASR